MIELEDARQQVLAAMPRPLPESVRVKDSLDRVIVRPIIAPVDLPPFDNSAMDGYAIRASDVSSASAEGPARLRLRGKIAAGQAFAGEVGPGECVRIFTGSPLPAGADAVVMQEDTRVEADDILILDTAKPFENVRLRGGDIKRGTQAIGAGEVVTMPKLALVSALGLTDVTVGKRPTAGVVVTGSELREGGQSLEPGQIYESNRAMLSSLVQRAGGIPHPFPLVKDTLEATQTALAQALETCDIVITSGGASVGELDFVKAALEKLGGEINFWQVAIRPGKPFFFGRCRGKFVFGLPGNPVSAFVTFLMLVRPALRQWQGATDTGLPSYRCVVAEPIANASNRRHFVRVAVDSRGEVRQAGLQASHALTSLAAANGLVEMLPQTRLTPGNTVEVLRLD